MNIYEMKLHEYFSIDSQRSVFRVAGGWVYTIYYRNSSTATCFVPFDNEYMKSVEIKPEDIPI